MNSRRSATESRQTTDSHPHYALRVNAFDRTSSVLIALLVLVGLSVAGLVVIYFSGRVLSVRAAIPVTTVNPSKGPSRASGMDEQKVPGAENAPEELEPRLESKLNVMAGLVAAQSALLDSDSLDPLASVPRGEGTGDPRGAEGNGTGPPVKEPQREIRFEPDSLDDYARWMDEVGIELGVLGNDNLVHYASRLSRPKPKVRTGPPKEETRLYFNSSGGPLAPLDRQLAAKAGIDGYGTLILQFCSDTTQQTILSLEQQAAGERTTSQIRRTIFRVEKQGSDYRFQVESQEYR